MSVARAFRWIVVTAAIGAGGSAPEPASAAGFTTATQSAIADASAEPDSASHGAGAVSEAPSDTIETGGHDAAPVLTVARKSGDIDVDGELDEAAWASATPVTDFRQRDPVEGAPASERTEVRALIGDDALYVGARLFDSEPDRIAAQLVRRDETTESDYLKVILDTYHDHLTASRFWVTPAGAKGDAAVQSNGIEDPSWDVVWEARTEVDSLGWTAEMRIPLSQLRYNPRDQAVWGIQLERFIRRKQETASFAFTPKSEQAGVNRYGHLVGLGTLPKARRLEIMPYTSGRAEYQDADEQNPFRDGSDFFGSGGFDLKYGLTSDLTLDATVNPDFGQVEVDPAVVNLSAFETFFEEKRPFFVEGADIFRFGTLRSFNYNFGLQRLFHARRIGRVPQRILTDDFDYVEAPAVTTIAGAAKLTGKTSGGWSVGVLDAVATREKAQYLDGIGRSRTAPVEPFTNYFAGRLRRDFRRGDTVLGGMLTSVHRDLDEEESDLFTEADIDRFADVLRSSAYSGGIDLNHAWSNRDWSFDAFAAGSHIRGSEAAIEVAQKSSARYFQRPDADHLDFDPTRTSLSGWTAQAALQKGGGEHWLGSLTYQAVSPAFETNDLGFQTAADRQNFSTLFIYKEDKPTRLLRNWDAFAFTSTVWNFGGEKQFEAVAAAGNLNFPNYWYFFWRGQLERQVFDDRLTRGGPLALFPAGGHVQFELATDSRKPYMLSGFLFHAWDDEGQSEDTYHVSLAVQPSSSIRLRLEPELQKTHSLAQFVDVFDDPTATETYGRRYVFATLDRTQLSLVTRLDWTFTPELSLQLFLQPLVTAADYTDLKEFRRPRTYDFDVYGRDRGTIVREVSGGGDGDEADDEDATYTVDPDGPGPAASFTFDDPTFNFRSLRGNAVLRWEYRPGSTLFLVWQQQRTDEVLRGDFDFSRDYGEIFDAPAENVFAIKATYWLGN